jgi:uncharacterized membrane protein YedE/YeeE
MQPILAFLSGTSLLWAGLLFGVVFGFLLQRSGVTDYDVIVKQFLFRDFTVLKVMLAAIVVGGVGVFILHGEELANFHIKPATMLAVILGAVLFGIGMVIYGYCPGTGVAAIGAGKLDALAGFVGMLVGGVLYAFTYDWVAAKILPIADLGKVRLPDIVGLPEWLCYFALVAMAAGVFALVTKLEKRAVA